MVLVVLDGWGHLDGDGGNAIERCGAPVMNALARAWPSGLLQAAGVAVGLPPGYIGNSEVGHLCLGAGRVVWQDMSRISRAAAAGEFETNPVLLEGMRAGNRPGAALHLMGLLSDGGVHSHLDHLNTLLGMAARHGLKDVFVHAFLDGRDTPPRSGAAYVRRAEAMLRAAGAGRIATVSGRYYAMDRDNRWERTEKAWRALVRREGPRFPTAAAAVEASYAADVGDEFVIPSIVDGPAAAPGDLDPAARGDRDPAVRDGDAIIFFNFRADRARQLTRAFTEERFDRFRSGPRPRLGSFVCFTRYEQTWTLPVAFPPQRLAGTFGGVIATAGLPQLRIAETEKYAHVTYFFNGGDERAFPGEERCLIPSARVATYDLKPEMMAAEVTAEVVRRLREAPRQVVILNYANADMVGHTGKLEPTIEACRVVDRCVGEVTRTVLELGGAAVVTADHGNAEEMVDRQGGPITAHTTNPVPVHLVGRGLEGKRLRPEGLLADVAPTMLGLLGIPQPKEMEGRSLFVR
jgi:2,3-bisphosphoglycerate-independent phosphoglycerate mutase